MNQIARPLFIFIMSLSLVLFSDAKTPIEPPANVLALQDAFAKVVELVKPAVVNIAAVQITHVREQPQFFYGDPDEFYQQYYGGTPGQRPGTREYRREGTGSGVIINSDGYILTNNHVVQGADELTVTMSDDKKYMGKVVGTDPRTDLAVIRITRNTPFPFVQLGDSSKSRVGDWVLALGSPFGLEQTVTSGIISAIRQSLDIQGKTFRNLLQTDAAINQGNSGGAMVNLRGELIGINTAIYAPTGVFSGIGFAIPVNDAKDVLRQLIQKGYVERSWMGVEIGATPQGVMVGNIVVRSPAHKAGIQPGDVILEFEGKKITNPMELQDSITALPPGRKVSLVILRNGVRKTLSLVTESAPRLR